jgi:hypothetical protein
MIYIYTYSNMIYIYIVWLYIYNMIYIYIIIYIHVYVLYMPWSSYMMPLGPLVLPQPRFCSGPGLPAWRKKACLLVESLFLVWGSLVDVYSRILVYIYIFFFWSSKIILNENNHCIRRLGSLSKMTQRAQFRLVLGLCKVLTQTRQQQALRVFRLASEIWVKPNVSVELPAQNRSSQKWWFYGDMMEYSWISK